jgi:hypothetical protein
VPHITYSPSAANIRTAPLRLYGVAGIPAKFIPLLEFFPLSLTLYNYSTRLHYGNSGLEENNVAKRHTKFNVTHSLCNRLILQYLSQQTAQLALNKLWSLCPSSMFRHLQSHHQGGIYKSVQVQQILSKLWVCTVKMQYCYLKLLNWLLSDLPRQKHKPDNTGTFSLNKDNKNWQRCLSAMEDKTVFRIVKIFLTDLYFEHFS